MTRKPPVFEQHPLSFEAARAAGLTRASCLYVVDGDTADFLLDLGWFQYAYVTLRFAGVDAPELRGTTGTVLRKARKAKRRAEALLLGRFVLVKSYKELSSFGRFLADVLLAVPDEGRFPAAVRRELGGQEWLDIGAVLLHEGLATPGT